jgi:hypothetical protein
MISAQTKDRIIKIWDKYAASDRVVRDTKGNPINDVDGARLKAIEDIKKLISDFIKNDLSLQEFKTALDGYNKRNNLWGFTAAKGQMFFNLLVNTTESIEELTSILKQSIVLPKNLEDAKGKLEQFEKFVHKIYEKGEDKRRVPKPGSSSYFLSYFWQIHDPIEWPVHYSSLVNSFEKLGLWKDFDSQKEEYQYFYNLNEEIKSILSKHSNLQISNWDAEHAFWNDSGNPMISPKSPVQLISVEKIVEAVPVKANFNVTEYLVPRVAKLVELGASKEKTKGSEFEKMVGDVFKMLDFEMEYMGQGTGRNPDALAKFREDHTAFIIDAKAYTEGYSLGSDDRAIREYINYYCPKLSKEGLKRIGFVIVSNSFKSGLEDFINEITWTTDVKRFVLVTSEALLYLLAYRTKDSLPTKAIIDFLIGTTSPITVEKVIAEFDDV